MRTSSNGPSRPASILAYDLETISTAETADGTFPPWPTHRIIAVGLARAENKGGDWHFDLTADVAQSAADELRLIEAAEQQLAIADVATSYNGRGFDALVLRLSAMRHRRFDLPALATHAASPRFAHEHLDLADLLSSHGAARRAALSEICEALGVPVKTQAHGSDVAALWRAGAFDTIRNYVLEDAVVTLVLYHAWAEFQGGDETLVAKPLAALAQHIERTPELEFLMPIAECELVRWCRRRAMRATVSDALARVTQRLQRAEHERSFAQAG